MIQIENHKSNKDQKFTSTAIITISIQIYALKSLTTMRANKINLFLKSFNLGDSNITHTISTMFVGGGEALFM